MPVGHQFFLDTPGASWQEEFLKDSMPRGILTVRPCLLFRRELFPLLSKIPYFIFQNPLSSSSCLFSPDYSEEQLGDLLQCLFLFFIFSLSCLSSPPHSFPSSLPPFFLTPHPTSLLSFLSPFVPSFLLLSPALFPITFNIQ